jgi:DNA-binding transcriptional LysR family regulator
MIMFWGINLHHIECFFAVATTETLRAAARRLDIPYSTLKKNLDVLQQKLGTQLIIIEKNGCKLTADGEILYEHFNSFNFGLSEFKIAIERMRQNKKKTIHCIAPYASSLLILEPILKTIRKNNPNTIFMSGGYGIDYGTLPLTDCALIFPDEIPFVDRSQYDLDYLASYRGGLYAHQDFIDNHGMPNKFSDLKYHKVIQRLMRFPKRYKNEEWLHPFFTGEGSDFIPVHTARTHYELLFILLNGGGIARSSDMMALFYPELVNVLPSYRSHINHIFFATNKNSRNQMEIKIVRDHMFETFTPLREKYKSHAKNVEIPYG